MLNTPAHSKIIIVDDEPNGKIIIKQILKNINPDVSVEFFDDGIEALAFLKLNSDIDLIITDFNMPGMDGNELVLSIRQLESYQYVPIIMVTVDTDTQTKYNALNAGVNAFLNRPIDDIECGTTCNNLLDLHKHKKIIENQSKWLSNNVHLATKQIEERERTAINVIGYLSKYKVSLDKNFNFNRFQKIVFLLSSQIGLTEREYQDLKMAAPLYDLGMSTINESLLKKKELLEFNEFNEIKDHAMNGYEILSETQSRYFQIAAKIALHHHENYDGSGYPFGLKGYKIPLNARIVSIVDCIEAMQSDRPHRDKYSFEKTIDFIKYNSGVKFDPDCVEIIIENQSELKKLFI